ncbi:MAG TPA: hypothetical protein VJA16_16055 [Thermoanaerobaculia bacterium]
MRRANAASSRQGRRDLWGGWVMGGPPLAGSAAGGPAGGEGERPAPGAAEVAGGLAGQNLGPGGLAGGGVDEEEPGGGTAAPPGVAAPAPAMPAPCSLGTD